MDKLIGYMVDPDRFAKLERIANRLGDGYRMSPDERRDLSNLMNLILSEMRDNKVVDD